MTQVCVVGVASPRTDQLNAQELKVEKLLSNQAILGSQFEKYLASANSNYFVLSRTLQALRQYVSGSCQLTYTQLKSRIEMWNNSDIKNDSVSVAARDKLIEILASFADDAALKAQAETALLALKSSTSNIKVAVAAPLPPVRTMADAAPAARPRVAVASNPQDFVALPKADLEKDLSDESIFKKELVSEWAQSSQGGNLFPLKNMISHLRLFTNGKESYSDFKARVLSWSKSDIYQNNPFSKKARDVIPAIMSVTLTLGNYSDEVKARARQVDLLFKALPEVKINIEAPALVAPPPVEPAPAQKLPITINGSVTGNKVLVPEYTVHPGAFLADRREVTATENQRVPVALSAHAKFLAEKKNAFYFKARVNLTVNEKGEVEAVQFTQVEVERYGKKGAALTLEEVGEFMNSLAGAYREEMAFPRRLVTANAPELFMISLSPAGAPERKLPREEMVDFVGEPLEISPLQAAKSEVIQARYEFDLKTEAKPNSVQVGADKISAELGKWGQYSATHFATKRGSGFDIRASMKLQFDAEGYLSKVIFENVAAMSGITDGREMKDFLLQVAKNYRLIHFEPGLIDIKQVVLRSN